MATRTLRKRPSAAAETIDEAIASAEEAQSAVMEDIAATARQDQLDAILAGASPDEVDTLRRALRRPAATEAAAGTDPDDELAEDWLDGAYPYKNRMSRRNYERYKYHVQVELLKLQAWVKATGQRVVILFEGRDAAGKGERSGDSWST